MNPPTPQRRAPLRPSEGPQPPLLGRHGWPLGAAERSEVSRVLSAPRPAPTRPAGGRLLGDVVVKSDADRTCGSASEEIPSVSTAVVSKHSAKDMRLVRLVSSRGPGPSTATTGADGQDAAILKEVQWVRQIALIMSGRGEPRLE
eukprot:CAMPEP_0197892724 /NCGR_PEP_ID=MMETSP1439-20131203/31380_1 /TAXON_ID=66791 /ORGANISM="Gonyaulax spinifera, Strain CCMP409" /LENGTH=144 /DNA_ID=CAMNT_0043512921 /DNA_START=65 /DNA_END=497 /DNA_ORIENTATION=-